MAHPSVMVQVIVVPSVICSPLSVAPALTSFNTLATLQLSELETGSNSLPTTV